MTLRYSWKPNRFARLHTIELDEDGVTQAVANISQRMQFGSITAIYWWESGAQIELVDAQGTRIAPSRGPNPAVDSSGIGIQQFAGEILSRIAKVQPEAKVVLAASPRVRRTIVLQTVLLVVPTLAFQFLQPGTNVWTTAGIVVLGVCAAAYFAVRICGGFSPRTQTARRLADALSGSGPA